VSRSAVDLAVVADVVGSVQRMAAVVDSLVLAAHLEADNLVGVHRTVAVAVGVDTLGVRSEVCE